jgi:hypothetical protein
MAAPSLMGAVLQREEGAFVPVRVTLSPGSLVLDLDARAAETLEGAGVTLEELTSGRADEIGVFALSAGAMRGYQLVQAAQIDRLEIGTPEVLAAFDREIELLDVLVRELDAAGPLDAPRLLVALRTATVEPDAGWDAKDRLEALRALRAHVQQTWTWERDRSPRTPIAKGETPPPVNPCRKLFHAGRKLAPDEWCGTGALAFHYCSDGCSMVEGECIPDAARFD